MMEYIANNTTNTSAPAGRTQSAPSTTNTPNRIPASPARNNPSVGGADGSTSGSYSKKDLTVYLEGI